MGAMNDLVYNERTGEFETIGPARACSRMIGGALCTSACVVGAALSGFARGMGAGMAASLPRVKSGIEAYYGEMTRN